MADIQTLHYYPDDYEREKASNSYLMSLVAIIAGLPLPIINLIATGIYFLANRKSSYFVRFHCIQALLSQFFVVAMNSCGFYWTISILFRDMAVTDSYISYMITILIFNVTEFIATIYAAVEVRKGKQIEFWFFGPLTHEVCKP